MQFDLNYAGSQFCAFKNLHSAFDYDEIDKIFVWLKEKHVAYHCFDDDLVFYKPAEATLFALTWCNKG